MISWMLLPEALTFLQHEHSMNQFLINMAYFSGSEMAQWWALLPHFSRLRGLRTMTAQCLWSLHVRPASHNSPPKGHSVPLNCLHSMTNYASVLVFMCPFLLSMKHKWEQSLIWVKSRAFILPPWHSDWGEEFLGHNVILPASGFESWFWEKMQTLHTQSRGGIFKPLYTWCEMSALLPHGLFNKGSISVIFNGGGHYNVFVNSNRYICMNVICLWMFWPVQILLLLWNARAASE